MLDTPADQHPVLSAPTRMTAMRVNEFGGPEVIIGEEIALPAPGDDQVLVRVHAAGVGPWDAWIRSGQSVVPQPLPLTLGSDVSGCVAAVGDGVSRFKRGDQVFGVTNGRFTDGYAEYALCSAAMLAPKPVTLTHVEAASAPVVAVTASQLLFDFAGLRSGQRVLIQGAAGNVGAYAVQLAHGAGLHVLATGKLDEAAQLQALGADTVIDRDAPGNMQVDAVIDLVGGEHQDRLFDYLAPGGILVSAVKEPDAMLAMDRGVRARFMLVDVRADDLGKLATMFEQGVLKPWVGTVLPLADAQLAHRMLAGIAPRTPGKIVLQVRP